MIDVLLLADLHGQYEKMSAFLELGADIVVIAGDLTDCGPVEPVSEVLGLIEVPSLAVPGNCDQKAIIERIEYSNTVNLHGTSIDIGNITFTGIGASNPTPFNTPFELSEEEIDQILTQAKKKMKKNVHNVLITHAPPYDTLDRIAECCVGSTSLRSHMKDFDLVCCAHIHEQKGIKECDGVTVVNPGPASEGNCALIHFGDEAKEFTIELLTL
jgi:Icc-related predicted phosphoesterase